MVKTVDVHNHLYPLEFLEYLEKRTQYPRMERVAPKSWRFYSHGVLIAKITKPGHYDPEARIADMDRYGIDIQILSMTMPG